MSPEQQEKQTEIMVLELVHSSPSAFVMDGVSADNERPLDGTPVIQFPSVRQIMNRSRVKKWNEKYKMNLPSVIRYINGCPSIDPEEQKAQDAVPNYLNDQIVFKHGRLTVVNTDNVGLFEFLKQHSGNVDNPNRPDGAYDIFREIKTELEAQSTEDLSDLQFRASTFLHTLKKQSAGKGWEYNEKQIAFLCSLFKAPAFESGFKSEAWVWLDALAKAQPKEFLSRIGDVRAEYESDVTGAVTEGVVTLDGARAFFTDGNKYIMQFDSGLNEEEQYSALTDFMSVPKNVTVYEHLRAALRKKRGSDVGIVK